MGFLWLMADERSANTCRVNYSSFHHHGGELASVPIAGGFFFLNMIADLVTEKHSETVRKANK